MLLFVECLECKTSNRVSHSKDIQLLVNKNKEIISVECTSCKAHFEVSFKLKIKDKKEKSKLALY